MIERAEPLLAGTARHLLLQVHAQRMKGLRPGDVRRAEKPSPPVGRSLSQNDEGHVGGNEQG